MDFCKVPNIRLKFSKLLRSSLKFPEFSGLLEVSWNLPEVHEATEKLFKQVLYRSFNFTKCLNFPKHIGNSGFLWSFPVFPAFLWISLKFLEHLKSSCSFSDADRLEVIESSLERSKFYNSSRNIIFIHEPVHGTLPKSSIFPFIPRNFFKVVATLLIMFM